MKQVIYNHIIDAYTGSAKALIRRLKPLKTTVEVSAGGMYHMDTQYSQVHLTTTKTEAEVDKWLYDMKQPIGYVGVVNKGVIVNGDEQSLVEVDSSNAYEMYCRYIKCISERDFDEMMVLNSHIFEVANTTPQSEVGAGWAWLLDNGTRVTTKDIEERLNVDNVSSGYTPYSFREDTCHGLFREHNGLVDDDLISKVYDSTGRLVIDAEDPDADLRAQGF